jgi:hypothetical protein
MAPRALAAPLCRLCPLQPGDGGFTSPRVMCADEPSLRFIDRSILGAGIDANSPPVIVPGEGLVATGVSAAGGAMVWRWRGVGGGAVEGRWNGG